MGEVEYAVAKRLEDLIYDLKAGNVRVSEASDDVIELKGKVEGKKRVYRVERNHPTLQDKFAEGWKRGLAAAHIEVDETLRQLSERVGES